MLDGHDWRRRSSRCHRTESIISYPFIPFIFYIFPIVARPRLVHQMMWRRTSCRQTLKRPEIAAVMLWCWSSAISPVRKGFPSSATAPSLSLVGSEALAFSHFPKGMEHDGTCGILAKSKPLIPLNTWWVRIFNFGAKIMQSCFLSIDIH